MNTILLPVNVSKIAQKKPFLHERSQLSDNFYVHQPREVSQSIIIHSKYSTLTFFIFDCLKSPEVILHYHLALM